MSIEHRRDTREVLALEREAARGGECDRIKDRSAPFGALRRRRRGGRSSGDGEQNQASWMGEKPAVSEMPRRFRVS